MICWGGLSFVTVAASGWQMVVRYGSSGGNLVKEGGGGRQARPERYGIDRERTYACKGAPVRSCALKRRGWHDIWPRGWMKGRNVGAREGKGEGGRGKGGREGAAVPSHLLDCIARITAGL